MVGAIRARYGCEQDLSSPSRARERWERRRQQQQQQQQQQTATANSNSNSKQQQQQQTATANSNSNSNSKQQQQTANSNKQTASSKQQPVPLLCLSLYLYLYLYLYPDRQPLKSPFIAFNLSLDMVRAIRPLVDRLQKHDPDLARQLRRATSSVALNLAEGRRRIKRDRMHSWRVAAGSADEVRACLFTAEAWGYLEDNHLVEALDLLDQLLAICWRLTH